MSEHFLGNNIGQTATATAVILILGFYHFQRAAILLEHLLIFWSPHYSFVYFSPIMNPHTV